MVVGSWAWCDQPIDQVVPILTSRLHEFRAEVVYCQWQYTQLQISTMTQQPGSHHPLHGLHLTANKAFHTRSCVGIGQSQRECSPLHHGEIPSKSQRQTSIVIELWCYICMRHFHNNDVKCSRNMSISYHTGTTYCALVVY